MNPPLLLAISMASALFATTITKFCTKDFGSSFLTACVYNALSCISAVLVLIIWGGGLSISIYTLLLGVVFGLITAIQTTSNLKAISLGPMAFSQLFLSSSMIIPALSGVLFFGESISIWQILGIALTFCAFILAPSQNANDKKASFSWLAFCLIVFFSTGFIGVLQKIHQSSNFKQELNGFLIVAFLTTFLVSNVCLIVLRKDFKPLLKSKSTLKLVFFGLLFGVFVAVNNKLNLFLSGVLDSALFFPLINGGGLVLTTLFSIIIFKEKLTLKRWIGVLVGLVAVILLCLNF